MSAAKTIAPDDPRTTAFRWMVRNLKADPTLARHVRNWWVWDGTPSTSGELPLTPVTVRLTPQWDMEEPIASDGRKRVFRVPIIMQVEVSTVGSNADNPGNLAGLIVDTAERLVEADTSGASGISWLEQVQPPQIAGENPVGVGSLRLVVFLER
jgi:hypothetical protein